MGGRGPVKPQLNFFLQLGHKIYGRGGPAEIPNSQLQNTLDLLALGWQLIMLP